MEINEKTFSQLLELHYAQKLEYTIIIENKSFPLKNVKVFNSSTPVRKPTSRGGVYFSDVNIFKIKGTIDDFSMINSLSKTMLGPNPEFKVLKIQTRAIKDSIQKNIVMLVNLTNSMQSSSHIELNMTIICIEEQK